MLVADDHAMVREGLARLVADQPDMRVVAQAGDGEQALLLARTHQPHVVVIDMRMPGALDTACAIARLRACCPDARVLVLSMYEDASYVRAALAAGAHAYVAKRAGSAILLSAIRRLHQGERLADAFAPCAAELGPAEGPALSARERAVIRLLVRGHTGREMAAVLGISKSSADTYRARVFRKLGVDSRAELVARVQDTPELLWEPDAAAPSGRNS